MTSVERAREIARARWSCLARLASGVVAHRVVKIPAPHVEVVTPPSPAATINVEVPKQDPPIVNVAPSAVNLPAPVSPIIEITTLTPVVHVQGPRMPELPVAVEVVVPLESIRVDVIMPPQPSPPTRAIIDHADGTQSIVTLE